MTYSPAELFATLDDLDPRAFLGLAIASIGYYIQYVANVRVGFRDRSHATPVLCNMWNFADDVLYLCLFTRWFGGDYSHWFTQALWFGMLAWVGLELATHYQTIRYSLSDLFPGFGHREALALYAGGQAGFFVLVLGFVALVDDPVWLLMITTTQFTSVMFAIPMLIGRGHRRGISTVAARAVIVAPPAFLALFLPAVAPGFDTPLTYVAAGACLLTALIYNLLLGRYPAGPVVLTSEPAGALRTGVEH